MVAPNLMVNQLINNVFSMLIIGFLISIAIEEGIPDSQTQPQLEVKKCLLNTSHLSTAHDIDIC